MPFPKLRRWAVTGAAVLCVAGLAAVAPGSAAYAETGGCPSSAHGVHTGDTAPYRAWACWIDDGDKIRVCDNAPNDGVHAHADLWIDIGVWLRVIAEDDGPDAGCDDENDGADLSGLQRVRLRVCAQRTDQSNFACNEIIWFETD